jgi:hypothetical protein
MVRTDGKNGAKNVVCCDNIGEAGELQARLVEAADSVRRDICLERLRAIPEVAIVDVVPYEVDWSV